MMIENLEVPDNVLDETGERVFRTIAKRINARPEDVFGLTLIAFSCQREDDASRAQLKLCEQFFLRRSAQHG